MSKWRVVEGQDGFNIVDEQGNRHPRTDTFSTREEAEKWLADRAPYSGASGKADSIPEGLKRQLRGGLK